MIAHLLIGGNLGNRAENLSRAKLLLEAAHGKITRGSSIYETGAWGITTQPDFLNQVLEFETSLPPEALMDLLLDVENQMGRIRDVKFGPRTIDIDILMIGSEIISVEGLEVPHPRLAERLFALAPLCELVPDQIHPVTGKSIRQMLHECPDKLPIRKLSTSVENKG